MATEPFAYVCTLCCFVFPHVDGPYPKTCPRCSYSAMKVYTTEYVEGLESALAEMTRERDEWKSQIEFMRDEWSSVGAKACPACLYKDGKFIRSCGPHVEIKILETERDNLSAEIAILKAAANPEVL